MKILLLTGSLYPSLNSNANLMSKLISHFQKSHSVHVLAPASHHHSELPGTVFGVPVHWVIDNRQDLIRRVVYPILAKLTDRNGYSDAIQSMLLRDAAKKLHRDYPFDVVISTMEPFPSGCAAIKLPGCKKFLYVMDPPACTYDDSAVTPYRRRMLPKILSGHDCILTTPFIRQALKEKGLGQYDHKIISVGFPMLDTRCNTSDASEKIELLFCGWMCSEIRSPQYFLDIVERLDKRFRVTFMGKECDKLTERFDIHTRAELVALPQQPYDVALEAMARADILINIGNSVDVHMPSKTLEYINTGKPMVNFHKLTKCPTLYYTNRYPLCLNLYEGDPDLDSAARRFISFCLDAKGKTVPRSIILDEYPDCTPEYIARQILDRLGD